MKWAREKARLLEAGAVRLTGAPVDRYIERSSAGPSAGGAGSVFFTAGGRRVRLGINPGSPIVLKHTGSGHARILMDDDVLEGELEPVGLHCPRQAYITVSAGCIFRCRYCPVPLQPERVKSPEEIERMIEGVIDRIDAISITSGVVGSVAEDEDRVCTILERIARFEKPVGVSIYPREGTPARLKALGVVEVKFNLETATAALFEEMCPGLDRNAIRTALRESVAIFGRNRVFTNVILGLGESDAEIEDCIRECAAEGVIPVIRPLNPVAGCSGYVRPSAERLLAVCRLHDTILREAGLDPRLAITMCTACTGCDLVPGRDCDGER
ncbi:MAG: radical SAM protein [Methanoculleus sp. SDB]|nr:MAG: radical SAM protein [Methanoculleus sp. SDB]